MAELPRRRILILDEVGFSVAELANGTVERVSSDPRALRELSGDLHGAGSVDRVVLEPPPSVSLDDRWTVELDGPVAMWSDQGRLLHWDASRRGYVEVRDDDVRVLDLVREPRGVLELEVLGLKPAIERLAALALLRVDRTVQFEPEPLLIDPVEQPRHEPLAADCVPGQVVTEPVRLVPLLDDLPDTIGARIHVVAYRLAGRVRRRLADRRRGAPAVGPPPEPAPIPDQPAEADVVGTPSGEVASAGSRPDGAAPPPGPVAHASESALGSGRTEATSPIEDRDATGSGAKTSDPDPRVPVIPLYTWGSVSDDQGFAEMIEPSLSIGMLFAVARQHEGGGLEARYNLQRIRPDADVVFQEWADDPRPAVFAFSDYLWNIDRHLDFSRRIKEISPASICLHGGPSVPKYEADAEQFFADHPYVDIAARGEGEMTFVEILERLDGDLSDGCLDRLSGVAGLTFRRSGPDGVELIRTEDRPRMASLEGLPSPYLTGEFDDLLGVPWRSASVESNRGCPYGCTYCDWGSATLARIRKFELERVQDELEWIMLNAAPSELHVADANFGIFARDVEIAQTVADLRGRLGAPHALTISLAKNTVRYSQQIIQILVQAGVSPITASSAVQTMDEHTLQVIQRQNIKLEKYDDLAVTFAEQGIPLVTDLLMGLPGATVDSFKNDLQHCYDREVTPRTMEIIMLPNSPMNEPSYREEHQIVVDDNGVVVGSSSFTRDDYEKMKRLRLIYRAFDHFGLLRHVLRFLQADRGLRAVDVMDAVDEAVQADPDQYPLLAFVAHTLDLYTIPPIGWEPFYDEVAAFLSDTFGLQLESDLAAVLTFQAAVMPTRGREYPFEIELQHDYPSYRADLAAMTRGEAIRRPLRRYGAASVRIDDPGDVRHKYLKRNDFPGRRSATTGNLFWVGYDWELESPLIRHLATNVGRFERTAV